MSRSPYKLLDYYRFEDADLFFGREEETRKMVGEILSSRLLVLFSPSGSGKTSLINAGVRPQLEEMGYKTIYTRLEDEPILSVCKAVAESLDLPDCREKEDLYEFLKKAAQAAGKPLVIFLDQFEEFFIVFRDQPKMRQEFVQQVARIKYDDRLPVFLVLSLREDYFVNLHEFRQDIPSIFQDNANIRLEPFTEKAARRAIEEPLKNKDIEDGQWRFEKKLVDAIIQDLKTEEGIEPIKLQLVCCTLWNQRPGDSQQIPLSNYEVAGRARKIFSNFIYDRLRKIPRRQHKLMVRIFESLKTPDNTKRYRSFEDLQSQLNIKKTKRLEALLQQLSGFDILRQEGRKGTNWYEFKHDYVIDEINQWIKECRERINRKRLRYAVLPGIILFLAIFFYFFIEYNTFYASFTDKDYNDQREEIIISRGIDPFGELITTGILIEDVKDDVYTMNDLRSKLRIGFWNKNNWDKLAETLRKDKSGEFLYEIGQTKLGIEKLVDALNESWWVQENATKALFRFGKTDKTVIEALIFALKDEYLWVRLKAADSLVRLGKADETSIDVLLMSLKDKDSWVRLQAAESLVRLGKADQTVIEVLIQAMKDKDEFSDVRLLAASSLGSLGKANKTVIEALTQAMKDRFMNLRKQAVTSLAQLGKVDQTVIEALILAMKDPDLEVREQAAASLIQLNKVDEAVIEALILAMKDKHPWTRRMASDSLGRLEESDKTVINALLQALKDEDYHVRGQAANSLGSLGKMDKTLIDALILAMKDKHPWTRRMAADSLGRLEKSDKTVIDGLFQALKDENFWVRLQAADSLVKLGKADKTVIEVLIKAMKDKGEFSYVRRQAAKSLGSLGKADETVIGILISALKDNDPWVREEAAASLGRLGKADKTVIDALLQALKNEFSAVRRKVFDSLVRLGKTDKRVIETLFQALKDKEPEVRLQAAASLGILWQKNSDPELIELLKHPLSGYRTVAAYALKQKKSLSPQTIDEINKLKDKDPRPWVRLGAWKAFELIQEKKEKEENKDLGE